VRQLLLASLLGASFCLDAPAQYFGGQGDGYDRITFYNFSIDGLYPPPDAYYSASADGFDQHELSNHPLDGSNNLSPVSFRGGSGDGTDRAGYFNHVIDGTQVYLDVFTRGGSGDGFASLNLLNSPLIFYPDAPLELMLGGAGDGFASTATHNLRIDGDREDLNAFLGGSGDGYDHLVGINLSITPPPREDAFIGGAGDGFTSVAIYNHPLDSLSLTEAYFLGGAGDGFDRAGTQIQFIDAEPVADIYFGGGGDGHDHSSIANRIIDSAPPPFAFALVSPGQPACGEAVVFDASQSFSLSNIIVGYHWSFGDGNDSSGVLATNTYGAIGTYTARLTVVDNEIPTQTSVVFVVVAVTNRKPVAIAGGPYQAIQNVPFVLNASLSFDPDADCGDSIVAYEWGFGPSGDYAFTSSIPVYTAMLASVGSMPIRLRVTDALGSSGLATGSVQIHATPYITFEQLQVNVAENRPTLEIDVIRTNGIFGSVAIEYFTSNGTAMAGTDFSATTGILFFADGQIRGKIVTGLIDDSLNESDETFEIRLRNPIAGARIGQNSNLLVSIIDNDVPGVLNIVATNNTTDEASGQVVLRVERSQGAVGAVSVDYTTMNGTATAGSDYMQTDGTLHFAASEFNRSVVVPILQDSAIEGTEWFSFKISNPSGGALLGAASNAVIDISDDDLQIQFSAAEFSVTESVGNALVKVKRSGDLSVTSRIDYATVNANALSGSDYIYVSGTLTFEPGQTELTIAVPMINDDLIEGADESFLVRLFNPSNGTSLGKLHESRVWIRDNDRYYLEASFDNGLPPGWKVKVNGHPRGKWRFDRPEDATYGRYAEADSDRAGRVKMDTELISPVMNLEDVDTFWLDFSQAWGLVSGGKERLDVDVSVNGQSGPWVNVIRQTPQNYIFSDYITTNISTYVAHQSKVSVRFRYHNAFDAQYWIIDDVSGYGFSSQPPSPGRLRIGSARTVRENAWGVQVDILREGGSSGNVQVDVNTVNGTATAGQDFTGFSGIATLSSGQENAAVYIRLHDDALIEGTETFSVQIGNPTGGATLSSPASAVITIIDDEGLLSDLGVSLATPPDPLLKHATWPMTVVVSNNGPSAASQAVLNLELPSSVVTVHTNLSQGSSSLTGSLFSWNVGGLNPFQSAQAILTCRVPVVGTVTSAVSVVSGNADTVEENDRLHVTNEVRSAGIVSPGAAAYIVDESAGQLIIDVVRSEDALGAVSVEYVTIPGTALAGEDYVSTNGVLNFADGGVSRPLVILLIDDLDLEGDEFFYIQLHNPEGVELGSTLAAVTLRDDEVLALQSVEGFDAVASRPGGAGLLSSQGSWMVMTNSGSSGWRFDDPGQRGNLTGGTGAFAIADSVWFASGGMDTELVSPIFNVGDLSRVILSFATDVSGTNGAEAVVMVSTQGLGGNWEWLWSSKGNLVEGPETVFLDVTELFGPQSNVMFSFRYFNATNDGWWQVDDVRLLGEGDSDGDGLPDWWENLNFKNLAQTATNDYDADGIDNLTELQADTSPTNAASSLEIRMITVVSNRPGIRFDTSPQRLYDIDASLELQNGWNSLETSIPGSGLSETIMLDSADSNRMFRMKSRGF